MRRIYTPVHIKFLRKKVIGRSFNELTRLFNERFGLSATVCAVRTLCTKYGLCNGCPGGNPPKYTSKHIQFLKKNVSGRKYKDLAQLFNTQFGTSVSEHGIMQVCWKNGLRNDLSDEMRARFPKGHTPHNKGKKGQCSPGSEKGWFKKGHRPARWRPVGSERTTVDGYVEIKVYDKPPPGQKRWRMKHIVIWEKKNGPVPKGHVILFADGSRENFQLNNLILVSRKELAVLNHLKILSKDKEFNKVSVNVARLKVLVAEKKRGSLKIRNKEKLVIIDNNGNRVYVVRDNQTNKYFPVRITEHGEKKMRAFYAKSYKTIEEAQKDLIAYALKRGWQRV